MPGEGSGINPGRLQRLLVSEVGRRVKNSNKKRRCSTSSPAGIPIISLFLNSPTDFNKNSYVRSCSVGQLCLRTFNRWAGVVEVDLEAHVGPIWRREWPFLVSGFGGAVEGGRCADWLQPRPQARIGVAEQEPGPCGNSRGKTGHQIDSRLVFSTAQVQRRHMRGPPVVCGVCGPVDKSSACGNGFSLEGSCPAPTDGADGDDFQGQRSR